MFGIFKKVFGFGGKSNKNSYTDKVQGKINLISDFCGHKLNEFMADLAVMREKAKNLSETNYKLGLSYLEKGNVSEAIFRFKIVKRFWPDKHDAYYQLAYCYILIDRPYRARIIIEELWAVDKKYKNKISGLLDSIKDEDCRLAIEQLIK